MHLWQNQHQWWNHPKSDTVKYLGWHLDQNLNLRKHVITKCQSSHDEHMEDQAHKKILNKRHMSSTHTLSGNITPLIIVMQFLLAALIPTLSLMQKVQNTAARMILNKHRSYSATECLKQLHWLPIKSRIIYKVLTIVFKCRHGMAPKYLQEPTWS